MSVNVSSSQMQDGGFVPMVADALAAPGCPSALVIELTESGSIGESEVVAGRLRLLRAMGVRVAIDDFGSGYSSFTYLRRLRVDILKIEKSFVDELLAGGPSTALVEGMIRLGGSLGLLTIGEGVEEEAQHAALVRLGCSMAQGYLHSRPVPMDELLASGVSGPRGGGRRLSGKRGQSAVLGGAVATDDKTVHLTAEGRQRLRTSARARREPPPHHRAARGDGPRRGRPQRELRVPRRPPGAGAARRARADHRGDAAARAA